MPQPTIFGTVAWGARPSSAPITVLNTRPTMLIIHHTADPNSTDYSQAHAFALCRAIQNHHMDDNGWIDSGQQFTISRGGYIMEGRHRSLEVLRTGTRHVRGAHVAGQNDFAIGIENEGTYITVAPTQALWNAMVAMSTYICQQYAISPSRIFGHRDFNNTECPGDVLYGMLPTLRDEVAARLGLPNPSDPVNWPTISYGDRGHSVLTTQYLLRARGRTEIITDSVFGPLTDAAVLWFQENEGIEPDGIVGSETWPQLVLTARLGDRGETIIGVQRQLVRHGYPLAIDGTFSGPTESAVRAFQSSRQLGATGVVDLATWRHLVAQ